MVAKGKKSTKTTGSSSQQDVVEIEYLDLGQFDKWLRKLGSNTAADVAIRLAKVRQGDLGSYRDLREGVFELKFSHPPIRIYYGWRTRNKLMLILCAGKSKANQQNDVAKAKKLWKGAQK